MNHYKSILIVLIYCLNPIDSMAIGNDDSIDYNDSIKISDITYNEDLIDFKLSYSLTDSFGKFFEYDGSDGIPLNFSINPPGTPIGFSIKMDGSVDLQFKADAEIGEIGVFYPLTPNNLSFGGLEARVLNVKARLEVKPGSGLIRLYRYFNLMFYYPNSLPF